MHAAHLVGVKDDDSKKHEFAENRDYRVTCSRGHCILDSLAKELSRQALQVLFVHRQAQIFEDAFILAINRRGIRKVITAVN
jgi:hypothetical protein